MAQRVTCTTNSSGHDGTYVYRSTSTMDPQNLPAPIADEPPVAQGATFEYIDNEALPKGTYYYRVQDHESDQVSAVSDEFVFDTSGAWSNIAQAAETGASVSTSAYETNLVGIYASPDGAEVYVTGNNSDRVHQWHLSTPWDLSTAAYVREGVSGAIGTSPHGLWFREDGSRLFVADQANGLVLVFDLATPWDISTATNNAAAELSVSDPRDIAFSKDGARFYKSDNTGVVEAMALATAWDPSSSTGVESSADLSDTTENGLYGLNISDDESQMVVSTDSTIYLFNLATPGDLSTATFDSSVAVTNGVLVLGTFVSRTVGKVFYTGWSNEAIYEMEFSE